MTVGELIEKLQTLPKDALVITNECEASSTHENITELDTVKLMKDCNVYVGSSPARQL